jgi:hypothetical protein
MPTLHITGLFTLRRLWQFELTHVATSLLKLRSSSIKNTINMVLSRILIAPTFALANVTRKLPIAIGKLPTTIGKLPTTIGKFREQTAEIKFVI